jgi:hypothetical protein
MNSWTCADLELKPHYLRLERLASLHDNPDDIAFDAAAANLRAGRPAFWSTARYSNAVASLLLDFANRRTFADAFAELSVLAVSPLTREVREQLLDTLLPLNHAAAVALVDAYQAEGLFRTYEELVRRTARAEGTYIPTVAARVA